MDLKKFGEGAQKLGVLGIKVTQNGVLTAQQLWDEECRRNIYSASKSFTSCAVGFAAAEGLLSLDEKLVDAFLLGDRSHGKYIWSGRAVSDAVRAA